MNGGQAFTSNQNLSRELKHVLHFAHLNFFYQEDEENTFYWLKLDQEFGIGGYFKPFLDQQKYLIKKR